MTILKIVHFLKIIIYRRACESLAGGWLKFAVIASLKKKFAPPLSRTRRNIPDVLRVFPLKFDRYSLCYIVVLNTTNVVVCVSRIVHLRLVSPKERVKTCARSARENRPVLVPGGQTFERLMTVKSVSQSRSCPRPVYARRSPSVKREQKINVIVEIRRKPTGTTPGRERTRSKIYSKGSEKRLDKHALYVKNEKWTRLKR